MIKRSILVLLFIASFIAIARLNPIHSPELPGLTQLVKLDATGKSLHAWSGPWKCVHDTQTDLVWEVKSYTEDIHDHDCSFSWYDGETGVLDGGNCYTASGQSDTLDIIESTNREQHCGLATWRLPTEVELRTLLVDTPVPGGPHIASDYFPYASRAAYWTSDSNQQLTGHFKYLGHGAIAVGFRDGRSSVMPYRNTAFVRLVSQY